jgi:hypothetical protein
MIESVCYYLGKLELRTVLFSIGEAASKVKAVLQGTLLQKRIQLVSYCNWLFTKQCMYVLLCIQ